jgi:hypothetical protein
MKKFLMVLAISLSTTAAFADADMELSAAHPDINTPNCEAHAYFAPNTNIVIIEMPFGKCDSVRSWGSDMGATETRITSTGMRVGIEGRAGLPVGVTLMNLEGYPFRKDEIRIRFN